MKGRDALSAREGADCVAKFAKQIPALWRCGYKLRQRSAAGEGGKIYGGMSGHVMNRPACLILVSYPRSHTRLFTN